MSSFRNERKLVSFVLTHVSDDFLAVRVARAITEFCAKQRSSAAPTAHDNGHLQAELRQDVLAQVTAGSGDDLIIETVRWQDLGVIEGLDNRVRNKVMNGRGLLNYLSVEVERLEQGVDACVDLGLHALTRACIKEVRESRAEKLNQLTGWVSGSHILALQCAVLAAYRRQNGATAMAVSILDHAHKAQIIGSDGSGKIWQVVTA